MKKILIVIICILITNVSYAASEKVYLKCKKIVTENKSTGLLKDMTPEGNFAQIVLTEIIIAKKSSKITIYEPFPDFDSYKESFNIKITDPVIPKRKALVFENTYTGANKFSGKEGGEKIDTLDVYKFTKDNDTWILNSQNLMQSEGGIDINYFSEGECLVIDKKYYKNILKNGSTQTDYIIFNYTYYYDAVRKCLI